MKPRLKKRFDHLPGPPLNKAKWPGCDLPWGSDEEWGATWLTAEEKAELKEGGASDADLTNGWFNHKGLWPYAWEEAFLEAKKDIYRRCAMKEIDLDQQTVEVKELLDRYRCNWA